MLNKKSQKNEILEPLINYLKQAESHAIFDADDTAWHINIDEELVIESLPNHLHTCNDFIGTIYQQFLQQRPLSRKNPNLWYDLISSNPYQPLTNKDVLKLLTQSV